MEKRKEKIELLKSLTLGREDTIDLSPLFQVGQRLARSRVSYFY